ncbi:MAG TPA: MFS transporter [Clostridia bacterium]|nr:MFS transporter [Clostridia bacterium]
MRKKLLPLFLSQSFRSVAVSLLSFFSAIYIFKSVLNTGSGEKQAFLAVFLFYLVLFIFKFIGVSLAEELALKFGLKRQVFIGQFLNALAILAFVASQSQFLFLWLASALWGAAIGFFWFGWHGLFIKDGYAREYGKALGLGSLLETSFLLLTPFLGGVLIGVFGYQALFWTSFFFIFLGVLAILTTFDQKTHHDTSPQEVLGLFWTHKRMTLSYLSSGILGVLYSPVFILYVFFFLKKELALGGFFSLSMIVTAIANYSIGKRVDQKGKRDLIAYGSYFSFLAWLGRFLVSAPSILFIFDVIYRLAGGMLGIPLGVLTYQKARDGHSTGRALLFRELAITLGSVLACLLLIVFVLMQLELRYVFLGGAGFSLLPLLIVRERGIYGEPNESRQ